MLPALHTSSTEMLDRLETLVNNGQGSCEVDVWPHLQNMTGDVISRTAFGRSYEDGRRIFQLITELSELVSRSILSGYIPGWRYILSNYLLYISVSSEIYLFKFGTIYFKMKKFID